ncbi:MAG: hypothetical protein MZV70_64655 [Desulfobacterales bacterium]|nr:hypothetical protein [Desulfobacterales bacterium]
MRTEAAENDALINAMRRAGVTTLAIGYESPMDEELRAMRKGVTVEKLIARSKKLSDYLLSARHVHFWLSREQTLAGQAPVLRSESALTLLKRLLKKQGSTRSNSSMPSRCPVPS